VCLATVLVVACLRVVFDMLELLGAGRDRRGSY
jgi:hypothetical protein